jgi:hypothetical protein
MKLKTNMGSLLGKTYDNDSYCFNYNRKGSADNQKNLFTLTKYYHLLQNNVQIYERSYNNIFDLLSEIGGVVQSIFYIFFWMNYIYNRYIIAYDTNSLFFSVKENNEKKIKHNKELNFDEMPKKIDLNITNKLKKPLKKFESVRNYDINKRVRFNLFKEYNNSIIKEKSESKDCYLIKSINLDKSINFKTNINSDQNSSISQLKNNSNIINNIKKNVLEAENNKLNINKIKNISNDKMKKALTGFMKKEEINKFWLTRESLAKIDHKQKNLEEILENSNKKAIKQISFIKFLKDIILENTKGSNYFLIKFRKHLLSEEHLFKSHVKIILLEKQCKLNKNDNTNVFECFNEL